MIEKVDSLNQILSESDCLVSSQTLDDALDKMASSIATDLQHKLPIVVCVMNGGLIPTAALIERLDFPFELDYVHATRYGHATEGDALKWIASPQLDIEDRDVLIVDDIFDQGHTLQAIIKWFEDNNAKAVYTATVINKIHDRKVDLKPDYIGLDVEDRFLFGFGMDYKGFFRNLKGIYAIKDS